MLKHFRYYIILFAHLAVIILALISPFIFSWKVVLIGVSAFFINDLLVGYCFLSKWQFGKREGFTDHYFKKLGIDFKGSKNFGRLVALGLLIVALLR